MSGQGLQITLALFTSVIASEYPANYSNKVVHTDMLHEHDSTVVGLLLLIQLKELSILVVYIWLNEDT